MSALNSLSAASTYRRLRIGPSVSLLLIAICVAAAVGLASARLGLLALAVPLGALLLLTFASTVSVIGTVTLWALIPDSPTFAHLSTFSVTPRIAALVLLLIQCALMVVRGRITLRLTFPFLWSIYLAVVFVGGIQNDRLQAVPLFVLFVALPYVAGCTFGTNPQTVRGVIRAIVAGAVVLSAVAIVEFVRNKPFFAPVYGLTNYARIGTDQGNLRANAGWIDPSALGMFLSLAAFLVIDKAREKSALLAVGAALLVGGGIFVTQERSPLLGLAVGALAYIAAQVQPRARRRAIALVLVALLAVVAVPGPRGTAFRQFLGESFGGANSTAATADISARGQLVQLGVNALRIRPLVGFGYGSTANVPGNPLLLSLFSTPQISYTDLANWPLTVAVETGLLGLAALLLLVASNLLRLARQRAKTSPLPVPATLAGLIAALVTSVGVRSITSVTFFMFLLGCGSTACLLSVGGESDAPSGPLQPPPISRRT